MKATLWEGEILGEKRKGFRGPERGKDPLPFFCICVKSIVQKSAHLF